MQKIKVFEDNESFETFEAEHCDKCDKNKDCYTLTDLYGLAVGMSDYEGKEEDEEEDNSEDGCFLSVEDIKNCPVLSRQFIHKP